MRRLSRLPLYLQLPLIAVGILLGSWAGAEQCQAQQSPGPAEQDAVTTPRQSVHSNARIIEWVNQDFRVEKASSVYKEDSENSNALGEVLVGSDIRVVGVVVNGDWLEVLMPDETTVGFIPSAMVPSAISPPSPPISGHPTVHDTATLTVGDRTFLLAGIDGVSGPAADELQKYIATNGDTVSCDPEGLVRYVCFLPDGTDVARIALVNGAARPTPNAPSEYFLQRDVAQREKRGIWTQGVPRPVRTVYEVNTSYVSAHTSGAPVVEDQPVDVTFVDNEPLAYVGGESVAVLYDDDYGWGFWDGEHHWHHAPDQWRHRLDERFPHGAGINRHPETFVHQQAVALRGPASGGAPRPGMTAGPAPAVARQQAFVSSRPTQTIAAVSRPTPANGASSFVQQHLSSQAVAARSGAGFGAFGGGHRGAGAQAARAPVRTCSKKC